MKDKWYLYILLCHNNAFYTGITKDITVRLEQHNTGKGAKYTRANRPCELVYSEEHPDRKTAMKREIEIKKWSRLRKDELVDNDSDK